MGEAPDHIVLVETEEDVDTLESTIPPGSPTSRRPRCPSTRRARSSTGCARSSRTSTGPRTDDICYATTNRQAAVKQMAPLCDLRAGHRLAQLVELQPPRGGRARARRGVAPDRQRDTGGRGLARRRRDRRHHVGGERARGARPPARRLLRARGVEDVSEFEVVQEDVRFMLPKTIRQAMAAEAS